MDLTSSHTILDPPAAEPLIPSAHHLDLPDRGVKRIREDGQADAFHEDVDTEMCLVGPALDADLALSAQNETVASVKKIRVDLSVNDASVGGHDRVVIGVVAEAGEEASIEIGAREEAHEGAEVKSLVETGNVTLVEGEAEIVYKVKDEGLAKSEAFVERGVPANLPPYALNDVGTSALTILVDISTDDASVGGHDDSINVAEAEANKEVSTENNGAEVEVQGETKIEALTEGGTQTNDKVEGKDLAEREVLVDRVLDASLGRSVEIEIGTSPEVILVDFFTDDGKIGGHDDTMTGTELETSKKHPIEDETEVEAQNEAEIEVLVEGGKERGDKVEAEDDTKIEVEDGKEASTENDGAEVQVEGEAEIEAFVEGVAKTEDKVEDEDMAESEVFVEKVVDATLAPSAQDKMGTSPEKILVEFFADHAKVGGHDDAIPGAESETRKEPSIEDGTEVEAQNDAKMEASVDDGKETGDKVEAENETKLETLVEGWTKTGDKEEAQDEFKLAPMLESRTETGDMEEDIYEVKIEDLMEGGRETGGMVESEDVSKIEAFGECGKETRDKEESESEGKIEALVEGRTETGINEVAQDDDKSEALTDDERKTGNMVETKEGAQEEVQIKGEGGTDIEANEDVHDGGKVEALIETEDKVEALGKAKPEALVEEETKEGSEEEAGDAGKFEALVDGRTETGDKIEPQDEAKSEALVEGGTDSGVEIEDGDLAKSEAFVESKADTGVKVEDEYLTVTEAILPETVDTASNKEEQRKVEDEDLTITEASVKGGTETGVNVEDDDLTVTEAVVTDTGKKIEDEDLTVTEEGETLAEAGQHASDLEEPIEIEDEDVTMTEVFVKYETETGDDVEAEDLSVTEAFAEGGTETGVKVENEDLTITEGLVEGETLPGAEGYISDREEPVEESIQSSQKAAVDGPEERNGVSQVKLGPKVFTSSKQMFDFFYELLHGWPLNININKYEHMILMDLISKGHHDPPSKIGVGIKAFQIRVNPQYYSRCYYLIRNDGTTDDFSYRKCIDKLLPLPANMVSPTGSWDLDKIMGKETNAQKGGGSQKARIDVGPRSGKHFHGRYKGRGGRFGGGACGRGNYGHGDHKDR